MITNTMTYQIILTKSENVLIDLAVMRLHFICLKYNYRDFTARFSPHSLSAVIRATCIDRH